MILLKMIDLSILEIIHNSEIGRKFAMMVVLSCVFSVLWNDGCF